MFRVWGFEFGSGGLGVRNLNDRGYIKGAGVK